MRLFERTTHALTALCLLTLIVFSAQPAAVAAEATYLIIQVPGALSTFPMSINNSIAVTGYYITSPSTAAGFIRNSDGTLTTFNIAGALWTEPESINDSGDVTGFYEKVAGVAHGFTRDANGRIATFDPSPQGPDGANSQPVRINNFHEVAGNYPWPNDASAGFILSRTGTFTVFTYSEGALYPTGVRALNGNGDVVGYSTSSDAYTNGEAYSLHADGYLEKFSVPVSGVYTEGTIAEDINDAGVIAGWYNICPFSFDCKTQASGGFVRSSQGAFTLFNPPGTLIPPPVDIFYSRYDSLLTAPKSLSLNASGEIAGSYKDATGARHGFVRNPYGTLTTFDPPSGQQTTAVGINNDGVIAGSFYYDWNSATAIGFLRIPQ